MAAEAATAALINALNTHSLTSLPTIVANPVLANGDNKSTPLEEYIASIQTRLSAAPDSTFHLETIVPGTLSAGTRAAVRLRWQGTLSGPYAGADPASAPSDQPFETWEHAFIRTSTDADGDSNAKIVEITSVLDTDVFREQRPSLPRLVPAPAAGTKLGVADLKALYEAYIACINAHTTDAAHLSSFCNPTVAHNGQELDLTSYGRLMSDAQAAIDGLNFGIGDLVVDEEGQRVACRIDFSGVPVREFGGLKPCGGKAVRFTEQVIYHLEGGKIRTVLSIVDLETARRQLAG